MLEKIKILLVFVPVLLGFVAPLPVSAGTSNASRDQVCMGLGGCPDADAGVRGIIDDALNIISIITGVAGVVMVLLGGFRYITAGGDSGKISSAQNTIIWAVVGLVVAAMAQVLVRFVLNVAPNT